MSRSDAGMLLLQAVLGALLIYLALVGSIVWLG